jgi:hypothetical protein
MNLRRLGLTAMLTLPAVPALADASGFEGVYHGTLGTQEIVLEIQPIEGTVYDGRYFYRRDGAAIPLTIGQKDGRLFIQEIRGGVPTGPEWRLTIDGDKATGEFCQCNPDDPASAAKPRLPIALSLMHTATNDTPDVYRRKLLAFPLTPGPEIRVDDQIAYVMERDRRFNAALPRLTRFPDATVMAKVNNDLAHALDELRLDAAECLFGAQIGTSGAYWQQNYRVAVINRDVLSIGGWIGHQCGDSAYANDTVASVIYNLRTGERFDFERNAAEFFRSPTPPYDALRALYQKHRDKPKGICRERSEFDIRGGIYFAKDGLVIDPHTSVPHAYAGCVVALTVPYHEIRDLVRSDSPFYPLVSR